MKIILTVAKMLELQAANIYCPFSLQRVTSLISKLYSNQANGIPSAKHYHFWSHRHNMTWTSSNANITPQQLFKHATYEIQELVSHMKIQYIKKLGKAKTKYYYKLPKVYGLKVTEQRKRSHLRCWTIAFNHNMTTIPISYIRFQL